MMNAVEFVLSVSVFRFCCIVLSWRVGLGGLRVELARVVRRLKVGVVASGLPVELTCRIP